MTDSKRFTLPAAPLKADNNIRHQYPIHKGKWIKHPETDAHSQSFCRFTLEFTLDSAATIEIHISADNRFELQCDDQYVGMGPDRSDIEHWSFHSYRLHLEPGTHRLTADTHYLGLDAAGRPWAQTCIEPGFILFSENSPVDLNTGSAAWQVTKLKGVSTVKEELKTFFVVGPNYIIDAKTYFAPPPTVEAAVLRDAGRNMHSGTVHPGWKLYPSCMPEQIRQPIVGGRVRFVTDISDDAPFPSSEPEKPSPAHTQWQAMVDGKSPVTVPPQSRVTVLWDLEQYHTAYPELMTKGGAGARIDIKWTEAMFITPNNSEGQARREKGNRNEVAGKYFRGNGDAFCPDGPDRTFRPYWWRAGRYVRIVVETKDAPLTLKGLRLLDSRMALENESIFKSSDVELEPIIAISARGIQMCAHESYMDCPYYEQMMYVGDTRLQVLTSFIMNSEDRLNQRALEIFDWSRLETGFVLERCPSQPKQLSCTFAMIWLMMLRDYAWWRNDHGFLKQRLKGMRCMLEEFKALPDTHAPLLPALPGWSFMDWVEGLSFVNNPGPDAGVSGVVNLLFINSLNAAAELEMEFGDKHLAEFNRAWARQIAAEVEKRFWDKDRGLFADDLGHKQFSEHSQCLALLSGLFPAQESRCLEGLISAPDLLRTTCYFSFYLLETFAKFGRGDLILQKLDFWKKMADMGLKTPVEMPEPTRSDCHAWSSHPLFHMHASLAGIRPDGPGFARVRIAPNPGPLTRIASTIPHPAGKIALSMELAGNQWTAKIALPAGIEGSFDWKGQSYPLKQSTDLRLPA